MAVSIESQLFEAAKSVRQNSHSPYSGMKVASAVRTEDGHIISGVNIENASYGGTVCAERVAYFKAVSEGSKRITHVLVLVDQDKPWPPCGFCRQVMVEFSSKDTPVYLANLSGVVSEERLGDLLPKAFGPEQLA